jgi:hypothetical protein
VFPSDLYTGTKRERTFVVTNDFLKMVYSSYLRNGRYNNPYKLPAPVSIVNHQTYVLPTTNLSEAELNKMMNNNSDSFTI